MLEPPPLQLGVAVTADVAVAVGVGDGVPVAVAVAVAVVPGVGVGPVCGSPRMMMPIPWRLKVPGVGLAARARESLEAKLNLPLIICCVINEKRFQVRVFSM